MASYTHSEMSAATPRQADARRAFTRRCGNLGRAAMVGRTRLLQLSVRGISKAFGAPVLEDVSFEAEAGIVTALLGPNGAGKTTLFNVINGFLRPDRGEVHLGDRRLDGRSAHRVARLGVARLFQDVRVLGQLSILDNLLLGLALPGETALGALLPFRWVGARRPAVGRAREVLELVALDVDINRPARLLSYGQQKRLALARALMSRPSILLLDEPTSGLDPAGVDQCVQVLERLRGLGLVLLLIEHNRSVVERAADRVIFLDEGRVLRSGDTAAVMEDPELARRYLGQ